MAGRLIDCFRVIASAAIMLAVLAFSWQSAVCQSQQLRVTITTDKISATVTEAEILVDVGSNMFYMGGRRAANWVAQPGLLVTDPVVPPEGFKLQATRINWAAIKEVAFFACKQGGLQQPQAQKLIFNSGETRNVYLWYTSLGDLTQMGSQDLKIAGNMLVEGKIRGVEFQADACKPMRLEIQVVASKAQ